MHRWLFLCFSTVLLLCPRWSFPEAPSRQTTAPEARQQLLQILAGEWVARAVYTAAKLQVADQLQAGPCTLEQLSTALQVHPESLGRLLRALEAFGVFQEVAPRTFAQTAASALLSSSHPQSLRALTEFYGEEMHKAWDALVPCIQTGTPAFQIAYSQPVFAFFKASPDHTARFQAAMQQKSRWVAQAALQAYPFCFGSICDIGGGQGQFLQALLAKNPGTQGTLFELPEVIERARQQVAPLQSSCSLVAGDFFQGVPPGADAYLLKSVIHDWEDDQAVCILRNCLEAMKPESKLLLIEVVLQPGPERLYAHCMDLLMLAITGGRERSLQDFQRLFERSGLRLTQVYPTATEFSILEAVKL